MPIQTSDSINFPYKFEVLKYDVEVNLVHFLLFWLVKPEQFILSSKCILSLISAS